ncbi:MAG: RNA-binding transcriptional accessory protein, partial [Prevotella sp.]|nr:RNA-binding transcriptional accessory protein [Prevotella sp.]
MNVFTKIIAEKLAIPDGQVENTLKLLDEGCTIPFISRYRKERTGGLNEVQVAAISEWNDRLKETARRKETIISTITEQGNMTDELKRRIDECWDATVLEDIYLPYRPKRRTRASIARELGLEPLAEILLRQREQNPERAAERFVGNEVTDVEQALKGAQDIIAEQVSEDERSRAVVRQAFRRGAVISSKAVKAKRDSDEARKYSDYFDWSEPLRRCTSHRLLAMRRGEREGILRVS